MQSEQPEVFVASRLTRGNFLFPTRIEVSERTVMRSKRSWLSRNEESIHIGNVGNVHIQTGVMWSDIRIESTGGSDPIESHGHTKEGARRIKQLIETYQAELASQRGADGEEPAGETKVCPHCAERIKRAAKVCRYCGRDVA
jgi:hypothetical protein